MVRRSARTRADGFGKFGGGTLFEEIATGTSIESMAEVTGASECGEDDDAGGRVSELELGC